MNFIVLRRRVATTALLAVALLPWGAANAQVIPALPEVSPALATAHPELVPRRTGLIAERTRLRELISRHNAACRGVVEDSPEEARCDEARKPLARDLERHVEASHKFIGQHLIASMNRLAGRLEDWNPDERKRLGVALKKLDSDGDQNVTDIQVRQAWQDVLARGRTTELAQQAAAGEGPGLYGAGEQTTYSDCAVFALATAAGLPYGVVAARATELIGDGEWRNPTERAAPQKTIEQNGLLGGEVVFLAEAFGEVEVVGSKEFAATLRGGRPVMINVVPASGDFNDAHQVVLAKVFQRGGQTWYELLDSNQGPLRRLYLSAAELDVLLRENGVAFRPEKKTTAPLLR